MKSEANGLDELCRQEEVMKEELKERKNTRERKLNEDGSDTLVPAGLTCEVLPVNFCHFSRNTSHCQRQFHFCTVVTRQFSPDRQFLHYQAAAAAAAALHRDSNSSIPTAHALMHESAPNHILFKYVFVEGAGREADHSTPSSAEVKNAWSYASMAWCLVKHRDNFTLLYLYLC
jgi:hypothetical protein